MTTNKTESANDQSRGGHLSLGYNPMLYRRPLMKLSTRSLHDNKNATLTMSQFNDKYQDLEDSLSS